MIRGGSAVARRRSLLAAAAISFLLAAGSGCGDGATDPPPDPAALQAIIDAFGLTPLPAPEYPQYNPYQPDRIALGHLLFFDPILGGESAPWIKAAAGKDPWRERSVDVACATCHVPGFGFGDGRKLAAGVGAGIGEVDAVGPARRAVGTSLVSGASLLSVPRNSITILNAALNGNGSPLPAVESFQFLDGRVTLGLEVQALLPLTVRNEMAGDAYGSAPSSDAVWDSVAARVRAIPGYLDLFRRAYPAEIAVASDIRLTHISKAIAAYERELITPGSRYDAFVGGEFDALTARERRGFELFFGDALCGDCHRGPMLSDYSFHVQGVADAYDDPTFPGKDGAGNDFGRFHANPLEFADEKYAFRTMTVRNVEQTGPYFHSGSAATLRDVVAFYNAGGRGPDGISDATLAAAGVARHPSIRPLGLTDADIDALVAFMRTTTGTIPPGPGGLDLARPPARVPSGLLPPGIPTPDGPGPFYPE